ncbi:hypothetical protein K491DRAFT_692345 [Lophiostoma macrostomum CBS 122681]|uniref:Uncharacterized protein n=1 Tax=Lophiostoma macrostomum CBS 122681 TaxID=1314788 RepID=A0A6A6TB70_9PLEO|nr:hypothetical protein K491DRAFT_692345 [Lophiostoma macrostomum CBS 122681]
MTDAGSSREDAPLLRRPVSRDASVSSSLKSSSTLPDTESNGKDGNAVTLSWLRGSLIASSIGLLIFLQGTLPNFDLQKDLVFIGGILNTHIQPTP